MSDRARWVPLYVVALLVVAGVLAFAGYDAAVQSPFRPTQAAREPVPDMTGVWEGTWHDTVFHVERPMSWEITQQPADLSATGSIDMTYFGMGSVPGSAAGTISRGSRGDTLRFTFEAATVGSGSGTIAGTVAYGMGTVTPPLDFGTFVFTAAVSDTYICGFFMFVEPGAGAGRVLMTRDTPVEPSSWGKLKARYSDDD